jgi:hypothetical protein
MPTIGEGENVDIYVGLFYDNLTPKLGSKTPNYPVELNISKK